MSLIKAISIRISHGDISGQRVNITRIGFLRQLLLENLGLPINFIMLAYLSSIFHAGPVNTGLPECPRSVIIISHFLFSASFIIHSHCRIKHLAAEVIHYLKQTLGRWINLTLYVASAKCKKHLPLQLSPVQHRNQYLDTKHTVVFIISSFSTQNACLLCRSIFLPSHLITNPNLHCAPESTPKEAEVPRRFSLASSLSASSTTRTKGT